MERQYTKQDVFRHKTSRKIWVWNRSDYGTHEFCDSYSNSTFKLDEMEYLGRNSQIVLIEDATLEDKYFVYGSNGLTRTVHKVILTQIDKVDKNQPYQMRNIGHKKDDSYWCRIISHIPFDELEDNLFDPFDYPNVVAINGNTEFLPISEDLNKTILVKQPKALI